MESNTEEVDNSFVSIEDCASRDNITNVENVRDGDSTVIDEATINLVTSVKKKKASKEQRKKWNKTAQQKSLLSDPKPGKKEKGLLALSNWNAKKRRQRHEDGVVPGRRRIFPHPQKRNLLLTAENSIVPCSLPTKIDDAVNVIKTDERELMDLESVTIADKEQHERRRYSKLLPCLSPDGNIQKPIELLSDTPPAPDKRRLVRLPVTGGIERYFTKTEPSPDALTALMNVPPLFLTDIQQLLISLDDSTKDDYNAREFGMKLIVSSATDETLLVSSISCGDIRRQR